MMIMQIFACVAGGLFLVGVGVALFSVGVQNLTKSRDRNRYYWESEKIVKELLQLKEYVNRVPQETDRCKQMIDSIIVKVKVW